MIQKNLAVGLIPLLSWFFLISTLRRPQEWELDYLHHLWLFATTYRKFYYKKRQNEGGTRRAPNMLEIGWSKKRENAARYLFISCSNADVCFKSSLVKKQIVIFLSANLTLFIYFVNTLQEILNWGFKFQRTWPTQIQSRPTINL